MAGCLIGGLIREIVRAQSADLALLAGGRRTAAASLWTSSLRRIIEVRSRPADLDRGLRVTSSAHGDQWSTLKPSVALHEPAIYLKAWLEGGMKLGIFKVENGGDHTQEAVWLKALEDCNLNLHILADLRRRGTIQPRASHLLVPLQACEGW